jgi:preprotein translocase subunit SecA
MGLIVIIDAITGKIEEREQTRTELEQAAKDKEETEAREKIEILKKAKRQAVLEKLGLDEQELIALLG